MKQPCVICTRARGKRVCKIRNNNAVCPPCCASTRNADCAGCRHYTFSQQYQAFKDERYSGTTPVVLPVDLDVKQQVEQAIALLNKSYLQEGKNIILKLLSTHPRNYLVQYAMGLCQVVQSLKEDERLPQGAVNIVPARFN